MAHFHIPKPLHGWREFVGEVGIIVLGVLIALGAEQVVEHFHDIAQLHEAEGGMIAELRGDDLPQAFARVAIHNCLVDQLNAIESAVTRGDRAKLTALGDSYGAPLRTWDDQAWKAALASQALTQGGSKRLIRWAMAYVTIPGLSEAALEERRELPQLRAKISGTRPLSPVQQDRLFEVVADLKSKNQRMSASSLALMRFASEAGVVLTAKQRAGIMADARRNYGPCVQEPSQFQTNFSGQFNSTSLRQ